MPPTRYSSTSRSAAGTSTATRPGRFPGASVPKSRAKPSAAAPARVALSSSVAAVISGRQPPHLRKLVEQVQCGDRGQAVRADRHVQSRAIEVGQAWRARADPEIAARTRHQHRARPRAGDQARRRSGARRAPPACPERDSRRRPCTARDRHRAQTIHRTRRRVPRAAVRMGPRARPQKLDLLDRLPQMNRTRRGAGTTRRWP